ncbi:MAG: hypothetical protein ACOC1P_00015 [Minisyncoccales bacterium]
MPLATKIARATAWRLMHYPYSCRDLPTKHPYSCRDFSTHLIHKKPEPDNNSSYDLIKDIQDYVKNELEEIEKFIKKAKQKRNT